jgi:hypothetical protein
MVLLNMNLDTARRLRKKILEANSFIKDVELDFSSVGVVSSITIIFHGGKDSALRISAAGDKLHLELSELELVKKFERKTIFA